MAAKKRQVGIRELKAKLSEYVRDVKSGATIVVTEHGRRVARIVPEGDSLELRLDRLKQTGTIAWSGRGLRARKTAIRARGRRTVAEVLIENRG